MNAAPDLSLVELITNAHVIVQLIMALLLGLSLVSWTYIFTKLFAIRAARTQTEKFERTFWAGGNLHTLHQNASSQRDQGGALARIFEAGMGEYIKGKQAARDALDTGAVLDGARRAMRAAFQRELDALDIHLNFLASVGSVSPYVGLLGTVWGIYHALGNVSAAGIVQIDKVAGPVGEALIMTGFGLVVAIPAVLAYNAFNRINRITSAELDGFAHDLLARFGK